MSEHGTHESYAGYNAIYDWKELDNSWALKFLQEAERLEGQENFTNLKEKVEIERSCKWLKPYWDDVIKEYRRTQLKRFAYKIIYHETPEQIPEKNQKLDLCGICNKELFPQLTERITILTCGHLFHWHIEEHNFDYNNNNDNH
ncbi:6148_t:CDS:2, partial [Diversispora eburnea]